MTSVLILLLGVVMLWMLWSDRGGIKRDWRAPANSWRVDEAWRSRAPSQPALLVVGTPVAVAAVVYGVVSLVT